MTRICACCLTEEGDIKEYINLFQKGAKVFYLCDDCYMHVNGYSKDDLVYDESYDENE